MMRRRTAIAGLGLAAVVLSSPSFAADRDDLGPLQYLRPSTLLHVEILDPVTEQISWFGETDDGGGTQPNLATVTDPTGVVLGVFAPGLIPVSMSGEYLLQPIGLDLDGNPGDDRMSDWDIHVDGAPVGSGRVWSRSWTIWSATFGSAGSTDGSFYAVVAAGAPGVDAVVELKAQGLSGNSYFLSANDEGVRNGNGRSTLELGTSSAAQHQIYLRPPDPALVSYSSLSPTVSSPTIETLGICDGVAPGANEAVIGFVSDVEGTYHMVCDVSGDGLYDLTSDDDLHILGDAVVGLNEVVVDGLDNLGDPLSGDSYDCIVRLTVGEFHFVANDIETSYEGFRLFNVDMAGVRTGLTMFWNDAAVAYLDFPDPLNPLFRTAMPGGEFSLDQSGPNGVPSGNYSDVTVPNINARAWGSFISTGKGGSTRLDTYAYLDSSDSSVLSLDVVDIVADGDGDLLSDGFETCLYGTSPTLADTDADGLDDYAEAIIGQSDPLNPDSDGDGVNDGDETPDPLAPDDSDLDGLEDAVDPDDDNDGVPTLLEGTLSTDGDGIPDRLDDDDDDDGVPTIQEDTNGDGDWSDDSDGDGIFDYLDDDDDGDGVVGSLEDVDGDGIFDDDTDGDGVPNRADPDDDNDGLPTLLEYGLDTDADTIPDHLDDDDDNDGVLTADEFGGDTDMDGTIDAHDTDDDGDGLLTEDEDVDLDGTAFGDDTDGDGIDNFLDDDDDGDLVPTALEDLLLDGDWAADDTDGDGTPNYLDDDDDDDTISTRNEVDQDGDGIPESIDLDTDDDGLVNYLDDDDDGDGIPTAEERDLDSDGDGTPDYLDTDADNDTLLDADEGLFDSDGDFTPDFQDADDDGDGIGTLEELAGSTGPGPDTDDDGVADYLDDDDDNDGIPTFREGGFGDDADGDGQPNHHDLDSDDDGIPDAIEGADDLDLDGLGSFIDLDADGDGFEDAAEGQVDSDGDGTPDFADVDDDNDGLPSALEQRGDTDDDGTPDRLDTDDDGDGISTALEVDDALVYGNDLDGDGMPNWVDLDSDGDGLTDAEEGRADLDSDGIPDYLDPDGAFVTYYKGSGLASCSTARSPTGWLALLMLVVPMRRRVRA